jgi:hypothetical protein
MGSGGKSHLARHLIALACAVAVGGSSAAEDFAAWRHHEREDLSFIR